MGQQVALQFLGGRDNLLLQVRGRKEEGPRLPQAGLELPGKVRGAQVDKVPCGMKFHLGRLQVGMRNFSEEECILNHRGKATSWHASGAFVVKVDNTGSSTGSSTAGRRGERAGEKGDVHVDVARGPAGYRNSMVWQATAQRDTQRGMWRGAAAQDADSRIWG